MQYTLNQLRIFHRVVATRSVTRAAEELHLSQPAVSIQLKNFQRQFELPLLEVVHRRIHVTDFGLEIARSAEVILQEVHAIHFKMHAHEGRLTGKLRLSAVSTGKYVAPYFVSGFMQRHPGVELVLDVTNRAQVLESLEQNVIDLGLVSVVPEHLRVQTVSLFENRLCLVVPPDHPLAEGTRVLEAQDFESLPLIFRERGSGTRHVMEAYFRDHNLNVVPKMVLTSSEAVKQAVMAGLGCSVMPLVGIRHELRAGRLRILPVAGFPITSTWTLIALQAKSPSPVTRAFLEYIESEKDQLILKHFGDGTDVGERP
jgi:DNA-binding transcriptional LysR family regulator